MHCTQRRQGVRLWLSRWLLSLGLFALLMSGAMAQGQQGAAVEAMGPPTIPGVVLTNKVTVPEIAHFPNDPAAKQRIRVALTAPPPTATPPTAPTAPTPPAATTTPPATTGVPTPATTRTSPAPPTPPPASSEVGRPGGNPLHPPPGTSQKPAPLANPEEVRITADNVDYRDEGTTAQGNVELRYQDLTVHSQGAELDKERVWGGFRDEVHLQAPLYSLRADRLRVNLETEEFSAANADATVAPEFFKGQVAAPIYVHATEVVGRPGRVVGTDATGTSCDIWPDPHWALRSKRVTLVPDNSVTFEKPTLYLWGHRLVRYPWDLRLSLVQRDNRFLPEVGQNSVEGYYAKFAYGYALDESNTGFLRLNLTQKRGVGLGFDHTLNASQQWAELSVFAEPEMGSFTGQLQHRGQYSKPFSSNLSVSYQQNSGYGLSSEALSGDMTFRYDTKDIQTLLGFQQSLNSSGISTSSRFSTNTDYRQRLGAQSNFEVRNSYYSSSFTTGQAADEELESEVDWRQETRAFTSNFVAQKRFDIDGSRYTGDSNYFRLDRLPDWTVTTDSHRIGDFRLLGRPVEAIIYLGNFVQHPDELSSYRTGADLRLNNVSTDLGKRVNLQNSLRFRQLFYDQAAQWVADLRSELRVTLPDHWETRLSYNFTTLDGFSPLRMDFASPANSAYFEAVRFVADRMRINMTFGRDFENHYYQDAILRAEILLSPRNRVELQGGYSVESSRARPLNLRWVYATASSWWSALTVNYDLDNSNLTNLSLDMDWTPLRDWRLQFLGGYSQFSGLNQADVRLTRDLHCMLAQLTYVYATSEIRVGLGIKAFPSATRTFGVGQRGQYFESNFNDVY